MENIRFDGATVQAMDGYRAYSKEIGGLKLTEPVYIDAALAGKMAVAFRKLEKRRNPALHISVAKAGDDTWVKFESIIGRSQVGYTVLLCGAPWACIREGVNPVDSMLGQEYPTRVTVDRKQFIDACSVLMPFAREANSNLAQIAANGRFDMSATAAMVGEARTFLDCITEGPDAAAHVNLARVRDAARNVKGELLDIGIPAGSSVPLAFYEFCESTPAAVVMPLHIEAAA